MNENGAISISTVDKRKNYNVIPAPQYKDWKPVGTAVLKIKKGECYLHVQYEGEAPVPPSIENITEKDVLGIDLGIKNTAVCSNNKFISANHLRNIIGRYQFVIAGLQSAGTRSAKRRLNAVRGRWERFVTDMNHCISKKLVNSKYVAFVLEDLNGIRKNAVKGQMKKPLRKLIGRWAFRMLRTFIEYKAEALGKIVIHVDPGYTSQECSVCGHIEKENRKGSSFECVKCGFSLNADLNASRNIAVRGISALGRVNSQTPVCSPS
jgi:IS605 OrfB family transposase